MLRSFKFNFLIATKIKLLIDFLSIFVTRRSITNFSNPFNSDRDLAKF